MAPLLLALFALPSLDDGLSISTDPCLAEDAPEIARIAAIELRTEVRAGGVQRDQVGRFTCAKDQVRIAFEDHGVELAHRWVTLAISPKARARVLALAFVELLAALPETETKTPTTAATIEAPPPPPPSSERAHTFTVEVAAVGGARFGSAGVLFGGGVDLRIAVADSLALVVSSFAVGRSLTSPPGRIQVLTIELASGLEWTLRFGAVSLGLSAHILGAYVRLAGLAADPSTFEGDSVGGLVWGPGAQADLRFELLEHLSIALVGEGGYWLRTVRGRVEGSDDVRIRGPWGGASAGLAIGW